MKRIIAALAYLCIGYYIGKGVASQEKEGKKKKPKLDQYDILNQALEENSH